MLEFLIVSFQANKADDTRFACGRGASSAATERKPAKSGTKSVPVEFTGLAIKGNDGGTDKTRFNRGRKMRKIVAKSALALALALAVPASLAQVVAPDALLRSVTQEVIGRIRLDAKLQAGDPVNVASLVETEVLPLIDLNRMAQCVMGRNWRVASPEQQAALIAEFKTLLVRTYSSALANYRGEIIVYKRLRAAPGDTEVTVSSDVKRPGNEKMSLDYDMEKTPEGWRIYDVKVAGVRLVTTYREAFAETVRESGVNGLIKSLSDMNRQGDSRFNSIKAAFWERSQLMYAIVRSTLQHPR